MRFCKYCGKTIPDTAGDTCEDCQRKQTVKTALPKWKTSTMFGVAAAAIAVIVAAVLLLSGGRCRVKSCGNKAVSGSRYCYAHKCALSDCSEEKFSQSNYCYSHYQLYDDDAQSGGGSVYSWELEVSGVTVSNNSSYTVAEGRLTNNSDRTVRFVKVKGAFEDRRGRVLDTDWTYAVGTEGLAPGESCKWRLSVDRDYEIETCEVTILDYDT